MNSPGIGWSAVDIDAFATMHKRQTLEWERRQQILTSQASGVNADPFEPLMLNEGRNDRCESPAQSAEMEVSLIGAFIGFVMPATN